LDPVRNKRHEAGPSFAGDTTEPGMSSFFV
jgi:hypothetical protein